MMSQSRHIATTALAALLALWAPASATPTQSAAAPAFTYNSESFLLHGEPYVIIGGQMDPQRIPPEYWRNRLSKARGMGLNTIFSYVYWNLMEPVPGTWTSDQPANDIANYFKIAQEEGLHVMLRPGPYICGEREWGGFPAWLTQIPGIVERTYNGPYLNASQSYLERLVQDLRPPQVTQGGPLLMVQVENEYGSYGSNHQCTAALRDILRANFDIPLYTNDGGVNWTLAGGEVPTVLPEIDGDPSSGFSAREQYVTDPSELGPLLDGEYYTLAPDFWGSDNVHNTTVRRPSQIAQFISDLDFVLGGNDSISLYMFHGGTNYALSNGAIWKNFTAAFTTSYDYGAPLDDSGRTIDLYFTLRDEIQKYVPQGSISQPPANLPRLAIPDIKLAPGPTVFDTLSSCAAKKVTSAAPVTMEDLSQSYGFVLYEHQLTAAASGTLLPGDRARDRVLVYVNGAKKGVIDSTYTEPATVTLDLQPGDQLQLLVENLGRVDYWSLQSDTYDALLDPFKGIVGNVTIGGAVLSGWDIYSLPYDEVSASAAKAKPRRSVAADSKAPRNSVSPASAPTFYSATFWVDTPEGGDARRLDTFLAVPTGVKGVVWVNGFNLGRYWIVGPQQSLYLPGTVLRGGADNEILVLELEPGSSNSTTMVARGEAERIWGNYPDPDAP